MSYSTNARNVKITFTNQGPPGEKGDDGPAGPTGPQGIQGVPGMSEGYADTQYIRIRSDLQGAPTPDLVLYATDAITIQSLNGPLQMYGTLVLSPGKKIVWDYDGEHTSVSSGTGGVMGGYYEVMMTGPYVASGSKQVLSFTDGKFLRTSNYQNDTQTFGDWMGSHPEDLNFPGVYQMDIHWSFQTHPTGGGSKRIYTFFTVNNMGGFDDSVPLVEWAVSPQAMDNHARTITDFPDVWDKTGTYQPMQDNNYPEDYSKYSIGFSGATEDKVCATQSCIIEIKDWSYHPYLRFYYRAEQEGSDDPDAGSGSGVVCRVTMTRLG